MIPSQVGEPEHHIIPSERHVLVLDISRSMHAPLPDESGSQREKIEIARSAVGRIVRHAATHRIPFGLVSFNDSAHVQIPLGPIRPEDLPEVDRLVAELNPDGRSAIWDALATAADLLRDGQGAVRGSIVLVTDGWDNASRQVAPGGASAAPGRTPKHDLLAALLPQGSNLRLRIIGIGNGAQRDKGVDTDRMHHFLDSLNEKAISVGIPNAFVYEEVDTGAQLYEEMVHAFLDVEETHHPHHAELPPDELARNAAQAARALKGSPSFLPGARLAGTAEEGNGGDAAYSEVPDIGVDVLPATVGGPVALSEKYGPLGRVVEAYLARDLGAATAELERSQPLLPPVTYSYWQAKIAFARGDTATATRTLLEAWHESESVPAKSRLKVVRRLALLQAQVQQDSEAETLIRFVEQTEAKLHAVPEELKDRVLELLEGLMELRGTYELTRAGTEGRAEAAQKHEAAVDEIFGQVQDLRLDNETADKAVDGTLDFVEILLAEMR